MDITVEKEEGFTYGGFGFKIAKRVVSGLVGMGVSHIVYEIVESNVDVDKDDLSKLRRVSTLFGKVALAAVIEDVVKESVDKKMDNAYAWWLKNIQGVTDDPIDEDASDEETPVPTEE